MLESDIQQTSLFTKLQNFFAKNFKNLNSWVEALDCLVYPEHRIKYWFTILTDLVTSVEASGKLNKQRLQELIQMLLDDVGSLEKPLVGD